MAPEMTATLVDMMKTEPFSINVKNSNDNDLKKIPQIVVKSFILLFFLLTEVKMGY